MIYLNEAASSWPKAPGVAGAVAAALDAIPDEPERASGIGHDVAAQCRGLVAELLGTDDPNRVVFSQNATTALNIAILGLRLQPGASVVTTVTEHNSVLRPLALLEDRLGLRVAYVGLTPDGAVDEAAFEHALETGPKLVAVNHASNVTGRVQNVTSLFARAKAAGAMTLLDASQSAGNLPLAPREMQADLIAFSCVRQVLQKGKAMAAAMFLCSAEGRFFVPA